MEVGKECNANLLNWRMQLPHPGNRREAEPLFRKKKLHCLTWCQVSTAPTCARRISGYRFTIHSFRRSRCDFEKVKKAVRFISLNQSFSSDFSIKKTKPAYLLLLKIDPPFQNQKIRILHVLELRLLSHGNGDLDIVAYAAIRGGSSVCTCYSPVSGPSNAAWEYFSPSGWGADWWRCNKRRKQRFGFRRSSALGPRKIRLALPCFQVLILFTLISNWSRGVKSCYFCDFVLERSPEMQVSFKNC